MGRSGECRGHVVSWDPGHQCDLCGNQWVTTIQRPELEASGLIAHFCVSHVRQYLAFGQFMVMLGTLTEYPMMTKADRERWPQNQASTVEVTRA